MDKGRCDGQSMVGLAGITRRGWDVNNEGEWDSAWSLELASGIVFSHYHVCLAGGYWTGA
jgi:hypothetical protein